MVVAVSSAPPEAVAIASLELHDAAVPSFVMTKVDPQVSVAGNCTGTPPAAATQFSLTDARAYLWFYATGVVASDVFSDEFYTPSGAFYAPSSGAWGSFTGNTCFQDSLRIAGDVGAAQPGTWTIKVKLNGTQVFQLTFDIVAPGGGCAYSLSATSQSVPAAGGTGSVGVTAGSGCTWTAVSNASWITISSGANGSGNGTVAYSAAANTATTARTGTLTIAGQTLTVTEASAAGGPSSAQVTNSLMTRS